MVGSGEGGWAVSLWVSVAKFTKQWLYSIYPLTCVLPGRKKLQSRRDPWNAISFYFAKYNKFSSASGRVTSLAATARRPMPHWAGRATLSLVRSNKLAVSTKQRSHRC